MMTDKVTDSGNKEFITFFYRITVHDGTAKIGSDYRAITGIILLSPAQTNRVINVGIIDDKNLEKNETFTVRLSNLGDSRINIGSIGITTVSIFDDDGML